MFLCKSRNINDVPFQQYHRFPLKADFNLIGWYYWKISRPFEETLPRSLFDDDALASTVDLVIWRASDRGDLHGKVVKNPD
jgi:hypothetical protein